MKKTNEISITEKLQDLIEKYHITTGDIIDEMVEIQNKRGEVTEWNAEYTLISEDFEDLSEKFDVLSMRQELILNDIMLLDLELYDDEK